MAALINSFISRATNIAVFHNRKAAPLFQHRRCFQIEDRQCRNQIAELLMKVDKTLGIRKLADVEEGFDGKDLKHHAQTKIIVRLICCWMKVCLDHLSLFVATHS